MPDQPDKNLETNVEAGAGGGEIQATGQGKAHSRRQFMRSLMWGSVGLFALEAGVAGLALFWPRNVRGFGAEIRVGPVENFPVGSVTRVREGKFLPGPPGGRRHRPLLAVHPPGLHRALAGG